MPRVVIVDDEALIRSGFELILSAAADIDVVATTDDLHAVDVVKQLHPQVVLAEGGLVLSPRISPKVIAGYLDAGVDSAAVSAMAGLSDREFEVLQLLALEAAADAGESAAVNQALSRSSQPLQPPATPTESPTAAASAEAPRPQPSASEVMGVASARVSDTAAVLSAVIPLAASQGAQGAEVSAPQVESIVRSESGPAATSFAKGASARRGTAGSMGHLSVPRPGPKLVRL